MLTTTSTETETTTTTPPPAGEAAPKFDWAQVRASLPEDLQKDPSMGSITSIEGLAKSYVHAQKSIGRDKITIPDKHATPEDWKGVFTKLGVPEKLEEYKMSLDGLEVDETLMSKLKTTAHEKGILPWQLESVVKSYAETVKEMQAQHETSVTAKHQENVNALKQEWGKAFDVQVQKANAAMRHLLPDVKDQQALIAAGFGDNPAALKMLAKVGGMLSEDVLVGQGDAHLSGMTPAVALEKARSIQGDPNHPYRNTAHPNHQSAKKEVADLYAAAFPE